MTMLQMEPVRPAVWDIQRDPRPLQEEPRGVQARQAQHLQEAGGERGRPQVTQGPWHLSVITIGWTVGRFEMTCHMQLSSLLGGQLLLHMIDKVWTVCGSSGQVAVLNP